VTARARFVAFRLRALAFTAALAGLSVASVASLALLFSPIPSAASFGAPLRHAPPTAPALTRGSTATAPSRSGELRAERPMARAAARPGADRGHRTPLGGPLPDVAPTSWATLPYLGGVARASATTATSDASARRGECLRTTIVCSPRETRAPPLG